MSERPFLKQSNKPTEQTIQSALGSAYDYYQNVLTLADSYSQEWGFTNSGGWMLKVFDKKKALFYLIPLNDGFKISLTIRETEREAFLSDGELKRLHDRISSSKKYSEGFALQFDVVSKKEYQLLETFLRKVKAMRE
jgi:hypothetical protein